MKGVCFQDVQKVTWSSLSDPRIESPSDAIVQTELAGLCGSDLHPFFGRELGLDPGTVMGHEYVGKVVAIGSDVHSVRVGDRVYGPFSTSCGNCFYCLRGVTSRCVRGQLFGWREHEVGLHGAQAELVRVPLADGTLKVVPTYLSPEAALLLGDNLSTGYFCAQMANIDRDGLTVVIGCGTVGLLAILSAKNLGAQRIVAIDLVSNRREIATRFGATAFEPGEALQNYVLEQTQGRGADSVMELVGLPHAQKLAFELLRPGGTMSVIGCHSAPNFAFTPSQAYDKNLTYRTGRCPARHYMSELETDWHPESWPIDLLITHRFSPEDCEQAYDIFAHQREGCLKALFQFQ